MIIEHSFKSSFVISGVTKLNHDLQGPNDLSPKSVVKFVFYLLG